MTKVAIIGAGIVGATAAYYLSKEEQIEVTVFDDGLGQATKAAAGIICPWFSKRRNKTWYRLARLGADFYQTLIADLVNDGYDTGFYQQNVVYVLKKDESKLTELYQLAQSRQEESPLIGHLALHDKAKVQQIFPNLKGFNQALYASGAARVDGSQLTQTLLAASGVGYVQKKVTLKQEKTGYKIDGQVFDQVILATGAWLGELLSPLGYQVDLKPQKGQLLDYYFSDLDLADSPVVMPEGEVDLIPFADGRLSVGASHENDKGFDLSLDSAILARLEEEALVYYPNLRAVTTVKQRVGIRGYTSDFSPFFGQIPQLADVYAVGGLGSSGLTTGPILAKMLVDLMNNRELLLPAADYPIEAYLKPIL
ncbi:FAD-binding oxidoreductase [Streptococcus sp. sy004]|uniref:NAD(P)/FAD-dependent oxidoreductase n=1 Tax=Streptococcus sp. sy004 TaxID=2600149 RepID=UPI0011B6CF58|nr:FAD-dependent oxidoreductase [Streptococcus sp. sy004]TWT10390.1 FAD-binding oxidoreductase [Streptococcus sp. sy004]